MARETDTQPSEEDLMHHLRRLVQKVSDVNSRNTQNAFEVLLSFCDLRNLPASVRAEAKYQAAIACLQRSLHTSVKQKSKLESDAKTHLTAARTQHEAAQALLDMMNAGPEYLGKIPLAIISTSQTFESFFSALTWLEKAIELGYKPTQAELYIVARRALQFTVPEPAVLRLALNIARSYGSDNPEILGELALLKINSAVDSASMTRGMLALHEAMKLGYVPSTQDSHMVARNALKFAPGARTEMRGIMLAAAQKYGDAKTLYDLALIYLRDVLISNRQRAIKLLEKAADLGNAQALYALGVIYLKGEGTSRNIQTALKFLEKAAVRDSAQAFYLLGLIYIKGEVVTQNLEYALYLLGEAANLHHVGAQLVFAPDGMISNSVKNSDLLRIAATYHRQVNGLVAEDAAAVSKSVDEDTEESSPGRDSDLEGSPPPNAPLPNSQGKNAAQASDSVVAESVDGNESSSESTSIVEGSDLNSDIDPATRQLADLADWLSELSPEMQEIVMNSQFYKAFVEFLSQRAGFAGAPLNIADMEALASKSVASPYSANETAAAASPLDLSDFVDAPTKVIGTSSLLGSSGFDSHNQPEVAGNQAEQAVYA